MADAETAIVYSLHHAFPTHNISAITHQNASSIQEPLRHSASKIPRKGDGDDKKGKKSTKKKSKKRKKQLQSEQSPGGGGPSLPVQSGNATLVSEVDGDKNVTSAVIGVGGEDDKDGESESKSMRKVSGNEEDRGRKCFSNRVRVYWRKRCRAFSSRARDDGVPSFQFPLFLSSYFPFSLFSSFLLLFSFFLCFPFSLFLYFSFSILVSSFLPSLSRPLAYLVTVGTHGRSIERHVSVTLVCALTTPPSIWRGGEQQLVQTR